MALWGKTDTKANRPKFLKVNDAGVVQEGPAAGKTLVFIDESEAAQASSKAKGVTGTGWYLISTASGRTRAELVVAVTDAPGEVADYSGSEESGAEESVGVDE
jgi:hypothetical protein